MIRTLLLCGTVVAAVAAYKLGERLGHWWAIGVAAIVLVVGVFALGRFGLAQIPPSLWSDKDMEQHVKERAFCAYILVLLAASSAPHGLRLALQLTGAIACGGAYLVVLRIKRAKAIRARDEAFE